MAERQQVVTVLVTDVEGSTALRTGLGDEAAGVLLGRLDDVIRSTLARNGAREIKTLGDGFLASFAAPRKAIRCAVEIQRALAAGDAPAALKVRIGINTGEVTVTRGDLAGEAVAGAARIAAKARGGEILLADVVRQLAGTLADVGFDDRGHHTLKGFPGRHRLFAVRWRPSPGMEGARIVGRLKEVALLHRFARHLASGEAQVLLIEGEAGIGKTRLLAEARGIAQRLGLDVAWGTADELERDRPFRAFVDALGLPSATHAAEDSPPGLAGHADRAFAVIDEIVNELEVRSTRLPLVLLLDDLQWADPASLRACRSIVRRLAHLRLGLGVAFRPSPRVPEIDGLVDDALAAGGSHLRLQPLGDDEVTALAAGAFDAEPDPQLSDYLRRAGGNPLYTLELAGTLVQDGAVTVEGGRARLSASTALAPDLRLTILRRLSALPEDSLRLVKTASVLGTRFSVAALSQVTGRPAAELISQLEEPLRAGVLGEHGDDLAFRHDLIREALYEELPASARRALHREIATALVDAGAPPEEVAEHLALGASPGDRAAVAWLREAARAATFRSAEAAVSLYRQAAALALPGTAEHHETAIALAHGLVRAGRAGEAEAVAREALAAGADEFAVRETLNVALSHLGRHAEAFEQCELALALPHLTDAQRAQLQGHLAFHGLWLGRVEEAARWSARATRDAEQCRDPYALATAWSAQGVLDHALGQASQAIDHFQRAVAAGEGVVGERVGFIVPHFGLGMALVDADRLDEALAAFDAGRKHCEAQGIVTWLPVFAWGSAVVRLLRGQLDDAEAHALTAVALAEEFQAQSYLNMTLVPYALLAYVGLARGDLAAAESALAGGRGLVERAGMGLGADLLLGAEALLAEVSGDHDRSSSLMGTAWSLMAPLPHLLTRRFLAADAVRLLRPAHPEDARAVVDVVEEGARAAPGFPARRGLALRCRGLLDDDPDALLAAVETYRQTPRVLERAWCAEDAGAALARAGRSEEAVTLLDEAIGLYEEMGASRFIARAQAALRSLGVRRRRRASPRPVRAGWDSLTATELDVVRLVVEGRTNREVGERLFISRRTVETHLSHVFTKLGVASRAQVAAEAARHLGRR